MWKPRVVVAAVIEQHNKFLIVEEEVDKQIVYNQPSGHLEANESLIEAVIRETLEETSWLFQPTYFLGMMHLLNPNTQRIFIRFSFTGTLQERLSTHTIDPAISQVLWKNYEEIMQQAPDFWRTPLVKHSLDIYRQGIRYPLNIINTLDLNTCHQHTLSLDFPEE